MQLFHSISFGWKVFVNWFREKLAEFSGSFGKQADQALDSYQISPRKLATHLATYTPSDHHGSGVHGSLCGRTWRFFGFHLMVI